MEFTVFKDCCLKTFAANSFLPTPTDEQIEKLYNLTQIMLEVNKTMNLTAITDEQAIILRHYADSLTISQYIPEGATVADVGCGAGFPTLPLAIFRNDIRITAIDSTAKRINYVNSTAKKLGLDNVKATAERAEVLGNSKEYRESFDIVTARAVAALPVLCELCIPLTKIGGQFIAMKAQKANDELACAKSAISKCGGNVISDRQIILTSIDGARENRTVVLIEKRNQTPSAYPRHFSKISKKPL